MECQGYSKIGIYIIYNFVMVFVFTWVLFSYSFMNIYIVVLFFALIFFGNMIIYCIYKCGKVISVYTAFNGFGILYTTFYVFQNILLDEPLKHNTYFAMVLSLVSIAAFDLVYFFTKKRIIITKINYKKTNQRNSNFINFLLIIVLIVSLAVEFYFLFIRINFSEYLAASRAQKSLMTSGASFLSFYTFTIPLVCIIALQQFFKYVDKSSAFLAFLTLGISILNSVISKSRAELIAILLPLIFLLEHYNKISKKKIVALLIGSLLLFGVWKSLFSSGSRFLYFDSEFNTWYEICDNVLDSKLKPLYGKSYLDTIINLIIPFTNSEPLSVWYVKTYEYDTWIRGGGRGFSAVLEAFMNFGILGNALIYGIYGWILKQIQLKVETDDDKSIIIYMILLISMFQFFRSESYSLWKNMMWFRVYPALILMWISNRVTLNVRTK